MNLKDIEIPADKRINTDADLEAVLKDISFENSVLDFNWRFRFKPFYEPINEDFDKAGWLIWVEFERPDIHTGKMGWGRGRDEIVRAGTYESGVVKTCWVLYEMIVKHEMMEGFQYKGSRIFNPHRTVAELSLPDHILTAKQRHEQDEAEFRNSIKSIPQEIGIGNP
jgi:hypothetical protein